MRLAYMRYAYEDKLTFCWLTDAPLKFPMILSHRALYLDATCRRPGFGLATVDCTLVHYRFGGSRLRLLAAGREGKSSRG